MVAAMLAVLKTGAAYLPLDPAFPTSRLTFMVEDSGLALVISQAHLANRHGCPAGKTINLDQSEPSLAAQPITRPRPSAAAEDPAYVLYTSGSTGQPKGVAVPHRAALNFLHGMLREPGLTDRDCLVAVTTLSFDIAFLELMLPLTVGARIVLASRDQAMDGSALRKLVETSQATLMQATPVTWRLLVDAGWTGHGSFRALCGGEAMPTDLAEALLERTAELWNMYGPTETTVWSACWRVQNPREGILVGRPIVNTTIRVLDPGLRPCPVGAPGEIYIGGQGLALGYLNRPALTSERFIDDPVTPGQRLYKTGDLGRWREGGLLECLGRTDFQVKVRGHRIELGEIEAALSRHPGIGQATVIVREDRPGDVRLVAYVIPRSEDLDDPALRAYLRTLLPEYMVPQHVVHLPAFPLTANGKIDRKALPAPEPQVVVRAGTSRALSPTEKTIAEVWCKILNVPRIEPRDNFFDLGGHSFIAVQAIAEVEKILGRRGILRDIIFLSLEQIAASYDKP
jgi:amino acid adenylation domain-containing protein